MLDKLLYLLNMPSSKNKEFIIIIKPWFIFNHIDSFRGEDDHAKQTAITTLVL